MLLGLMPAVPVRAARDPARADGAPPRPPMATMPPGSAADPSPDGDCADASAAPASLLPQAADDRPALPAGKARQQVDRDPARKPLGDALQAGCVM
jgi:hypothetical protein